MCSANVWLEMYSTTTTAAAVAVAIPADGECWCSVSVVCGVEQRNEKHSTNSMMRDEIRRVFVCLHTLALHMKTCWARTLARCAIERELTRVRTRDSDVNIRERKRRNDGTSTLDKEKKGAEASLERIIYGFYILLLWCAAAVAADFFYYCVRFRWCRCYQFSWYCYFMRLCANVCAYDL